MGKQPDDILHRVSNLEDGDSSREIYDDWSDTYDDHLIEEFGYVSPAIAASLLAEVIENREIHIMDYGCGTGLVGVALRQRGFTAIDGLDISEGMLAQARDKGVYRNLLCADLTGPVALADEVYAAATCIGSVGAGHIGTEHVPELLRPLSPGGLLVVIMNGAYYEAGGFEEKFRQLEREGRWCIHRLEELNYMTELTRPGWLLLAEKQA